MKEIPVPGDEDRYILCYNLYRAEGDQKAREAIVAYKGLWQVEECFRTLKTPLELRPIYHRTEPRVWGHVKVCFLAFLLRQHLRLKLKELKWEGSFTGILEALKWVWAVEVEDRAGHKYRLRDEIPAEAMPAFRALRMAPPKLVEKLS